MKKLMGLYDYETGKSIEAIKEVEATQWCEPTMLSDYFDDETVWLVYGNSQRGPICKLDVRNKVGNMTVGIHWFIKELAAEMNVREEDDTFGMFAGRMGISKVALKKMMEANQP